MAKYCFRCGAKNDEAGKCTNPNCTRYGGTTKTNESTTKTDA